MLKLFNTLGKKIEPFEPVNEKVVTLFTCGPSVYQRSHIGNFRTFLFEEILVRYLAYLGYHVKRGMNLTDVEDKAIHEAEKRGLSLKDLTNENINNFIQEMKLLKMKIPDYLLKASEAVEEAVKIIEHLLELNIAYWHRENVYFNPLQFSGFGGLYGLDMSQWPARKRRFHKDTYPGMQWNLGDFILWHGCRGNDTACWETRIGKGRPSWNIQDPSMISQHFNETLSIYCGGIDNLFRHHDYSRAILESIRPYPMARFWLHCHHLVVNGQKMSKSRGNVYYTDTLLGQGYHVNEIRFFLICGHYRSKLNYTNETLYFAAERLRNFRRRVADIERISCGNGTTEPCAQGRRTNLKPPSDGVIAQRMKGIFIEKMDDDIDVKKAFDGMDEFLSEIDLKNLAPSTASGLIRTLREIDEVLRVIF